MAAAPVVSPSRLRSLFGAPGASDFVAILSPEVDECVSVELDGAYNSVSRLRSTAAAVPQLLRDIRRPAHVLCITSDGPFFSPPQQVLDNLKLAAIPLYSTTFTIEKLNDTLSLLYELDYANQALMARSITDALTVADRVRFEFEGRSATLGITGPGCRVHVFDQSGAIDWSSQSVVPGGEVSLLANPHAEYSADDAFQLDGEIVLHGYPIVHRGGNPSRPSDATSTCEKLFHDLSRMNRSRTILDVANGCVRRIRSLDAEDSVERTLSSLFAADDRYRKIHEVGIGLNDCSEGFFSRENFMPNEMRLGVHFGLGLTSYTDFHIDLVCVPVKMVACSALGEKTLLQAA